VHPSLNALAQPAARAISLGRAERFPGKAVTTCPLPRGTIIDRADETPRPMTNSILGVHIMHDDRVRNARKATTAQAGGRSGVFEDSRGEHSSILTRADTPADRAIKAIHIKQAAKAAEEQAEAHEELIRTGAAGLQLQGLGPSELRELRLQEEKAVFGWRWKRDATAEEHARGRQAQDYWSGNHIGARYSCGKEPTATFAASITK